MAKFMMQPFYRDFLGGGFVPGAPVAFACEREALKRGHHLVRQRGTAVTGFHVYVVPVGASGQPTDTPRLLHLVGNAPAFSWAA